MEFAHRLRPFSLSLPPLFSIPLADPDADLRKRRLDPAARAREIPRHGKWDPVGRKMGGRTSRLSSTLVLPPFFRPPRLFPNPDRFSLLLPPFFEKIHKKITDPGHARPGVLPRSLQERRGKRRRVGDDQVRRRRPSRSGRCGCCRRGRGDRRVRPLLRPRRRGRSCCTGASSRGCRLGAQAPVLRCRPW